MPPVTRKGDLCTGHGCWPSRPSAEGDNRFMISGAPAHCQGHAWHPHTCPTIPETHASVLASGSSRFFVDGRQLGRIGDPVACGSSVASGEPRFVVVS